MDKYKTEEDAIRYFEKIVEKINLYDGEALIP